MEQRESITGDMTTRDVVILMSEGNPGAINAMMALITITDATVLDLLHLDDMNMRGSQIWVAFKDHCKQDLDVFLKAIRARDREMVITVNLECPEYKAVTHGGSLRGGRHGVS